VQSENQPLEELAEAVLEGYSVDWASVESSAGAPDREAIRQLKVLAGIAELHRNLVYDSAESARPEVSEGRLERWGRLELRERIGRGSFGDVYRAWDSKLDREVAVKLLHASGTQPEGDSVLKEARLLARVRHPNVVTVYDADEIEGRVGLWMEFIHGRNLEQILSERKKFDDREVTRIGIELSRALSAVHDAGLLHRDIKTQNLMQASDGRLVLMDFGTGRESEKTPASTVDAAGTPLYLAPEIFNGAQATVQTDIYSTGVLLFHLLTGAYPVRGATVKEVGAAHARGQRLDLAARAPGTSRKLAEAIGRAILPDPSGRFESARDMLAALEKVLPKTEGGKKKRYWLTLAAASLIAVALAVLPGMRRRFQGGDPQSKAGTAPYLGLTSEKRAVQTPLMMLAGTSSPDGRYLPYSEFKTGNLAIYEFATGASRVLTTSGDGGDNYATESIVSADSSHIAYNWNDASCECAQLRVMDAGGENARTLYGGRGSAGILPLEWSLDGREILATRQRATGETEVILLSALDGSVHLVRTFTQSPWKVALSPDSRYIAYDRAEDAGDKDRDIYLSTTDGSQEIPVVTGPAYDSHPAWTPDGSGLVFASMRTGGPGLWLQDVKDGRAVGPPRLLDKDMGPFAPITLTRQGSLFYRHRTGLMDVYTVAIDPSTGDVRGEPSIAANSFQGSNLAADWSPDGETLVFASWRTLFGPGRNVLVFHSVNSGRQRELDLDMDRVNAPHWSPDGRRIAIGGSDRKGVLALRLLDVESGSIVSTFFAQPGDMAPVSAFAWGSDGGHAYVKRNNRQGISRIDLRTREEELIYEAPPSSILLGLSLSPDGLWLASVVNLPAAKTSRLLAIPTGGGPSRELVSVPLGTGRLGVGGWTRDGRHILFTRTGSVGKEQKQIGALWAVPFEGGPARSVGLTMPSLRDVRVSPDGSRISFTSGFPDQSLWVFENFLPQTAAR
jgi:eukaryotic-like serine/threonine-protein kinase